MQALTAISPIDGRYRDKVESLAHYFSESALIRYRVMTHEEEPNIPQDLPMELRALFQRETQGKKSIELDSIPVSYTHLDVYKRQVYDRQTLLRIELA